MSAILRNTLRFIGTAKCATNNSTKYLQTMPHMANRLNDLLALNGPNYLQHQSKRLYLNTRDTSNKLSSSNVGHFIVSLNSGRTRLITNELKGHKKDVTLPCTFITKLNGKTIEPESHEEEEEEETSLNFGELNVSLDDGKLKLQRQDTGESLILPFIMSTGLNDKKIKLGSHIHKSKEGETSVELDKLNVSFDGGKLKLQRQDTDESLILPFIISPDLNGKKIEFESHKHESKVEKTSFEFGKLNVSLDGGKLKLQVKNTGETFILNHACYVEAYNKPPKTSKDGSIKALPPMNFSRSHLCDAKITSKTELGEFPTSYSKVNNKLHDQEFGNKIFEYKFQAKEEDDELTVAPNECGQMKLQFPMDVSLEGSRQVINIENSDDILTFYHTVDIQAYKELDENLKNEITDKNENRTSKIGKFAIQLMSGDLWIQAREPGHDKIGMKQEVLIIVDLDSEVPSIVVDPVPTIMFKSY